MPDDQFDPSSDIPGIATAPEKGVAVCLSGGGYRAMLFHVGSLLRLLELGFLNTDQVSTKNLGGLKRVSSVSGGSITAGILAKKWNDIKPGTAGAAERYEQHVTATIRKLADETIDTGSILIGLLPGVTVNKRIIKAYKKHLSLGIDTLDVFPDKPRFVINATNLQSGVLWRFMKPYSRDWKVGEIPRDRKQINLAAAIAASSAFPPVLSPAKFKFQECDYTPNSGDTGENNLQRKPFTTNPVLSDGGVYDNLGIEACWKRYETILVSDAGGQMQGEGKVPSNWLQQSYRVLNVIDNQVRSLRKRQLISSYKNLGTVDFKDGARSGTYWGIRTNITNYDLSDALDCPYDKTIKLAEIPTRLKKLDDTTQKRLINWGYAVCDTAIRKHVDNSLHAPGNFPYPEAGVG